MSTVSICIPAYNAAPYIAQTLETLLHQSYHDFTIMVSDNHSTDGTPDIVKCYQERDPRVYLTTCSVKRQDDSLRTISLSAIDNVNHVLSLADSDLVALYHADDLYHSNILSAQVDFFNRFNNISAVFSMGRILTSDGRRVSIKPWELPVSMKGKHVFNFEELLLAHIEQGMQLITPSCMLRRKSLISIGGFRDKYEQANDYDAWFRLAEVGPVGVIDQPLVLRRVGKHQDSFRGLQLYRHSYMPATRLFEDLITKLPSGYAKKARLHQLLEQTRTAQDITIAGRLLLDNNYAEALRVLERVTHSMNTWQQGVSMTKVYASILRVCVYLGGARSLVWLRERLFQIARAIRWRSRPLRPTDLAG